MTTATATEAAELEELELEEQEEREEERRIAAIEAAAKTTQVTGTTLADVVAITRMVYGSVDCFKGEKAFIQKHGDLRQARTEYLQVRDLFGSEPTQEHLDALVAVARTLADLHTALAAWLKASRERASQ